MDESFGGRIRAGEGEQGQFHGLAHRNEVSWARINFRGNKLDGYSWLGSERMLNPYAIVSLFGEQRLDLFWPQSGCPPRLPALVRESQLDYLRTRLDDCLDTESRTADLAAVRPVPVLFQSGCLTVDRPTRKKIFFSVEDGARLMRLPSGFPDRMSSRISGQSCFRKLLD
ncbi:MAG: hypothetical protein LBT40_14180 [Deltaproteobacteria bacterium]|jgi:hypothetical protein|nr:hypothetical protein [Deltaproteobacteria bacterium]